MSAAQLKMAVLECNASCAGVNVDFSGLLYPCFHLFFEHRHYFRQKQSLLFSSMLKNTWNVIEAFRKSCNWRFVARKPSTIPNTSALNYIAFLMHWCMHQKAHEKCRNIDTQKQEKSWNESSGLTTCEKIINKKTLRENWILPWFCSLLDPAQFFFDVSCTVSRQLDWYAPMWCAWNAFGLWILSLIIIISVSSPKKESQIQSYCI